MSKGEETEADWLEGRTRWQQEAYYLEHYEESEHQFREWCSQQGLDPEDVGSAIAWEEEVAERQEAAYYSSM